jgi:hypothetical protein
LTLGMSRQTTETAKDRTVFPVWGTGSFVGFPFFLYATRQNPT